MAWLTSLPALVLVGGWLAVSIVLAGGCRYLVHSAIPEPERDHVQGIAAPLMPALGATFAVLTALTLAGQAGDLNEAHDTVGAEANAASRLAWAATSPEVRTEPIHAALLDYLRATRTGEWEGEAAEVGDDPGTADAIAALEHVVRSEAARPELGTPSSTELLASLDALTTARRTRLAMASRDIPVLYVVTLVAGGLALVANAGALAFRSSLRTAMLIVGLASVVGLSLALVFAITAPWRGPLIASGQPIDAVTHDLEVGFFGTS